MFRPSKCSENSTHLQYSGSALIAIQPLPSFADSFARGVNLKLRQANARALAKVARAHTRVCRGLATPLVTVQFTGTTVHTP